MQYANGVFTAAVFATLSRPLTVTLTYRDGAAHVVQFAGDLNLWNPQPMVHSGDRWAITFKLPTDARFEYKFVVDGAWKVDPTAPKRFNAVFGENSVYEGPTYRAAPYADDAPRYAMNRSILTVGGRLVETFAPANAAGLPVVVFADGDTYNAIGHLPNLYANLVERGKLKPAVLVFVPPIDRLKEYGAGWHDYAGYLFEKVLPAVRAETKASDDPKDLYLAGSSMGGVISTRLAEELPNLVQGGVMSQSGAFQYAPLGLKYDSLITSASLAKLPRDLKLWMDWGTFEGNLTTANELAAQRLRQAHRPFGSKVTHEGHNWTAWRNRMVAGLTYLLGT